MSVNKIALVRLAEPSTGTLLCGADNLRVISWRQKQTVIIVFREGQSGCRDWRAAPLLSLSPSILKELDSHDS